MRKNTKSMTEGPLWSGILLYTIPIILTSVLQLLFNAADLVVVGRFCGSISVAAVGATGAITGLIVNLFIGLSVGAGVAVAHAYGNGDDKTAHRTVHTALPTAIICGAVLTVVGIALAERLLIMMDTPENVLPLSTVYMQIYFGGMTFNMVYNFCAAILRAAGDTKGPLIYLTIAGVVNVILNVIFVTLFDMNVAGVALATTVSQGISAVLVVIALMRRDDCCRLVLTKMKFYVPQLVKIIRIGLPAGIQSSLFAISNTLIQSSINSFGDVVMSGNAAASNIDGFVYVTHNSFSQAAVNYVGQNSGAGKYDRVKKTFGVCITYISTIGIAVSLLAYVLGPTLLSIYITDSPEAISYGMIRLAYICFTYFLCGFMDVSTSVIRGMGASLVPMIISVAGICGIRILWIYTVFALPAFHTLGCLYLSYPISWLITFGCQMVALVFVYRKQTGKSKPRALSKALAG